MKSPVVGELKRCEEIKNFKYLSIFRGYGEIEALTDLSGYELKKGEIVKFIWIQEGNYFGCIKGRPVVVYAYDERDLSKTCFFHKKDSKLEEWVKHKASNGKVGYSKVENETFFIPYGGYLESLICAEDRRSKL